MAKEIIVSVWCDLCAKDDVREPGQTTPPIAIVGTGKPRTLDLCPRHRKELLDVLVSALDEDGAEVAATGKAATKSATKSAGKNPDRLPYGLANAQGPFDCLVPGCGGRNTVANGGTGYPSLKALKSHLSYQHSLTFSAYREQHGVPVSLSTGAPLEVPTGQLACPHCDRTFQNRHGLSGHMAAHRDKAAS
jgi:hypothetical protein